MLHIQCVLIATFFTLACGQQTNYTVSVKTGFRPLSGTKDDVFLSIIGSTGEISSYKMHDPKGDTFHRNRVKIFTVPGENIGNVCGVSFQYPGNDPLFVKYVTVGLAGSNKTVKLIFNKWITKENKRDTKKVSGQMKWLKPAIRRGKKQCVNPAPGCKDITCNGGVPAICRGTECGSAEANTTVDDESWPKEDVIVTPTKSLFNSTSESYLGSTSSATLASSPTSASLATTASSLISTSSPSSTNKIVAGWNNYTVYVKTGKKALAGTKDKVELTVYGRNDSSTISLQQYASLKKNQLSKFYVNLKIDSVCAIKLRKIGTGRWYVSYIQFYNEASNINVTFLLDQLFKKATTVLIPERFSSNKTCEGESRKIIKCTTADCQRKDDDILTILSSVEVKSDRTATTETTPTPEKAETTRHVMTKTTQTMPEPTTTGASIVISPNQAFFAFTIIYAFSNY